MTSLVKFVPPTLNQLQVHFISLLIITFFSSTCWDGSMKDHKIMPIHPAVFWLFQKTKKGMWGGGPKHGHDELRLSITYNVAEPAEKATKA